MGNLLRLTYISRAVGVMDEAEMDTLLHGARATNKELGVTGLLCSGRGYYLQALEGPETNVLSIYAKIVQDPRHMQSELLSIGLVKDRSFSLWQMGHVEGKALGDDLAAKFRAQIELDTDASKPGKILQATLEVMRKAV